MNHAVKLKVINNQHGIESHGVIQHVESFLATVREAIY
jgi:hypothetical protein